jgi:hypothetical protein
MHGHEHQIPDSIQHQNLHLNSTQIRNCPINQMLSALFKNGLVTVQVFSLNLTTDEICTRKSFTKYQIIYSELDLKK